MLFNPEESIDFNGNTGPFIQYTYARIRSVLRKAEEQGIKPDVLLGDLVITDKEKELIKNISLFPSAISEASESYSPAVVANYVYNLVKEYNQFYHDHPILVESDKSTRDFRILLSESVAKIIKSAMSLLGINVPEKM